MTQIPLTRTLFFIDSDFDMACEYSDESEIRETFVCPMCGANFRTKQYAEKHLANIHQIDVQKNNQDLVIERRDIRNIC